MNMLEAKAMLTLFSLFWLLHLVRSARCPEGCICDNQQCLFCEQDYFRVGCEKCNQCDKKCPPHCVVCSSNNECLYCNSGYFGNDCETLCPYGCLYNQCAIEDGLCHKGKCKSNFEGQFCDKCVNGKFGQDCSQNCSQNCYNNSCIKGNGYCSKGCISGKFGYRCSNRCPSSCKTCDSDLFCHECNDGYWGTRCHHTCSVVCQLHRCNPDGSCVACLPGLFGDFCNKSCSNNCLNKACNRHGECVNCNPGYFGASCKNKCPSNCLHNICASNGKCVACIDGYYGDICEGELLENGTNVTKINEAICNFNRLNETCLFEKEMCLFGCQRGFYGQMCDLACNDTCLNSTCNRHTGVCESDNSMNGNGATCLINSKGNGNRFLAWTIGLSSGIVFLVNVMFLMIYMIGRFRKRRIRKISSRDILVDDEYETITEMASWRQESVSNDDNINCHMQLSTLPHASSQAQSNVDAENIFVITYENLSADTADETYREMQSTDYLTCV